MRGSIPHPKRKAIHYESTGEKPKRAVASGSKMFPSRNIGINDVLIRVLTHRHLRHRPAHLQMGRLGASHYSCADGHRPRVRRRDRRVGFERKRFSSGRNRQRRRPRGLRALPQLPGRAAASLRAHPGRRREPARRVRRIYRAADDAISGGTSRGSISKSPPSSIPSGTRCTRRFRSVLGEDVLITGAGRSASWRPLSCATPARATWSLPT